MSQEKQFQPAFSGQLIFWMILSLFALVGCSSTTPATPTATRPARTARLTSYASPTATATLTPTPPGTATPLPSPTPTPQTHKIVKGEDLFGIAFRYHITLDELLAANPDVNPHFLKIGDVLIIPASKDPLPTPNPQVEALTPTPAALDVEPPNCLPSAEGGAWCFMTVHNSQDFALENVSAIFRLYDQEFASILSQTAFLPLDILPPGAEMPLVAYFPAPAIQPFEVSAEILTALTSAPDNPRYLAVNLKNQQVAIDEEARSAGITVEVSLADSSLEAKQVWIAAVAYDSHGKVIGVRRWESNSAPALSGAEALPVSFDVYSVAGKIARVSIFAEARP